MRGAEKTAAQARQKNHRINQPEISDQKIMQRGQRNHRERGGGEDKETIGNAQDRAAAHHVCHMPGQQGHPERGHRFRQANQAKLERVVRQFINLPANGHALNLDRTRPEQPVKPERAIRRHAESGVGIGRASGIIRHGRED